MICMQIDRNMYVFGFFLFVCLFVCLFVYLFDFFFRFFVSRIIGSYMACRAPD